MRCVLFFLMAGFATLCHAATDIQVVTSPNGHKAWLVEERGIPFVALELLFDGGASIEPAEQRGGVNLMMALLEEGAANMDAQAFTKAKENLAASFSYQTYPDSVSVSARFLTESQDQSVGLLRQTLLEPRFDIDAIERVRAQIIAGLKSDTKDPAEIARAAFNQEAFGLSHPYGSDLSGRISTVEALTRDHVVQAHQNALVLDRIRISAVGDIGAEDLGLLLDALLKGIPAQSAWPLPKAAELALATGVEIVPFTTPQSVALFGHLGLDRDHPDFFAAYILNHIFGGSGFESRLMQALREERGLTYGVSTYLASRKYADLLLGQFASANDRMAEAVDILREEWDKIARNGIAETELQLAQTYLTGAYPLRFDGNAQIAQILVGMQQQGLQPSYLQNRNKKVMAVTLQQANRVAKELFRPELLRMFIVGEPEDL